ncbi:MAG: NADH:ubiquinone reductase (Na(+)-transporting) subunit B [Deltaproteobacteria bacterium]|nr:NADH:ubiquinone reductase (Na(+)-transporting) subunit B [Deltaproteobacteria bacterium]
MKLIRDLLDKQAPLFHKGGPLEKLYPIYEANDTLLFTPGEVTKGNTHVRDSLDLKRLMITVVIALVPCLLMALYNTGYQANNAISLGHAAPIEGWRTALYTLLFGSDFTPNFIHNVFHGALWFVPVILTTFVIGGHVEVLFAVLRKHEINEGFLVTGFLFPLTLPPTIPLWEVALGIIFGVVLAKEVFGGTGMNFLNVALTARAFLFFAYPAEISGDKVWIAANMLDGYSGATWLAAAASDGMTGLSAVSWWDAFVGLIPGSMGETSALAALLGALLLSLTGIGSWRIMLGVALGTAATVGLFNAVGSDTNPFFHVPFYWHYVLGGWAFGTVFMATDPVTASFTDKGRWVYGFGIGVMVSLVRVVNPAYPEGMMLAILFMNMFAPFIDYFVVQANIKRRQAGYGRLQAQG